MLPLVQRAALEQQLPLLVVGRLIGNPAQRLVRHPVVRIPAAHARVHAREPHLRDALVGDRADFVPAFRRAAPHVGSFVLVPEQRMERLPLVVQRECVTRLLDLLATARG